MTPRLALDSRAAPAAVPTAAVLPPHYPTPLIATRSVGGEHLVLRPVLPDDGARLRAMLSKQPADTLRWRFHGTVRPSTLWCERMSQVDYRHELALVVCTASGDDDCLVAEARYYRIGVAPKAECALMVDTRWQRKGLGRWLLGALSDAAADAGLRRLDCELLRDNRAMLGLALRCGFVPVSGSQDGLLLRLQLCLGDGSAWAGGAAS